MDANTLMPLALSIVVVGALRSAQLLAHREEVPSSIARALTWGISLFIAVATFIALVTLST